MAKALDRVRPGRSLRHDASRHNGRRRAACALRQCHKWPDRPPGYGRPPGTQGLQQSRNHVHRLSTRNGGEGGIRTHERIAPLRDFQSRLFGHSSTSPQAGVARRAPGPLAERVGFEPTSRCNREPLFESGAISLSATSPRMYSIPQCGARPMLGRPGLTARKAPCYHPDGMSSYPDLA